MIMSGISQKGWSGVSERIFVAGLGSWTIASDAIRARMKAAGQIPDKELLEKYVEVYSKSSHKWHQIGVGYALQLLEER